MLQQTIDLLATRRSVPAVLMAEPAPDDKDLETMLTIASRVPDHGKLAPWRFILYRGAARAAAGEALAALVALRDPEAEERRLEDERTRFTRAPLVIGVVSTAATHVKIPVWEQQLSAGAAAMNLILAAHALGYGAQWVTGWVCYDGEAAALLGLRDGEAFAGFIQLGTPTGALPDRPRPALADIVTEWMPVAG